MKVYNYMAQKGNMITIALAADSKEIAMATKKDSSAMKAIALLTMIFLPGTFVAVSIQMIYAIICKLSLILEGVLRNTAV